MTIYNPTVDLVNDNVYQNLNYQELYQNPGLRKDTILDHFTGHCKVLLRLIKRILEFHYYGAKVFSNILLKVCSLSHVITVPVK